MRVVAPLDRSAPPDWHHTRHPLAVLNRLGTQGDRPPLRTKADHYIQRPLQVPGCDVDVGVQRERDTEVPEEIRNNAGRDTPLQQDRCGQVAQVVLANARQPKGPAPAAVPGQVDGSLAVAPAAPPAAAWGGAIIRGSHAPPRRPPRPVLPSPHAVLPALAPRGVRVAGGRVAPVQ